MRPNLRGSPDFQSKISSHNELLANCARDQSPGSLKGGAPVPEVNVNSANELECQDLHVHKSSPRKKLFIQLFSRGRSPEYIVGITIGNVIEVRSQAKQLQSVDCFSGG